MIAVPHVADASFVLSLLLPDEGRAAPVEMVLAWRRYPLVVPALWPIEIAAVFRKAVRRGRATEGDWVSAHEVLSLLTLAVEDAEPGRLWRDVMPLAHRHDLTFYDACYLEVATRRRLPIATADAKLREAAIAEGVPLFDVSSLT